MKGNRNPKAERCMFRAILRKDNESIDDYCVTVKQAVRYCKFETDLDQMLLIN